MLGSRLRIPFPHKNHHLCLSKHAPDCHSSGLSHSVPDLPELESKKYQTIRFLPVSQDVDGYVLQKELHPASCIRNRQAHLLACLTCKVVVAHRSLLDRCDMPHPAYVRVFAIPRSSRGHTQPIISSTHLPHRNLVEPLHDNQRNDAPRILEKCILPTCEMN